MISIFEQFFTLPSGDERERLVPVLTTILRLSPEEEQKVQGIAKGINSGFVNFFKIYPFASSNIGFNHSWR